jgi:hypothetical protein
VPILPLITLALAPWRGPSLATASPAAVKYKLTVRGPAEHRVQLRVTGLPPGWVGSFCTSKVCSPFQYNFELNDRGLGVIEFQAIRTDDSAPAHVHAIITTNGARPVPLSI